MTVSNDRLKLVSPAVVKTFSPYNNYVSYRWHLSHYPGCEGFQIRGVICSFVGRFISGDSQVLYVDKKMLQTGSGLDRGEA